MPDLVLSLDWAGDDLLFRGGPIDGPTLKLDGNGTAAVSPVQALGLSLAGCMASDVVVILQKGRVPLEALRVGLTADRRAEPPRYLTRVALTFRARGLTAADEDKLRRAVALSVETYCSVLHSLRSDIVFETEIQVE
jgi:putative redox protein